MQRTTRIRRRCLECRNRRRRPHTIVVSAGYMYTKLFAQVWDHACCVLAFDEVTVLTEGNQKGLK